MKFSKLLIGLTLTGRKSFVGIVLLTIGYEMNINSVIGENIMQKNQEQKSCTEWLSQPYKKSKLNSQILIQDWINLLFLKFEAIFGLGWTNRHRNEEGWEICRSEWGHSLAKYSNSLEIIHNAVEEIKKSNKSYPPSLPEFLALCEKFEPRKPATGFHVASDEFIEAYNGMGCNWEKIKESLGKI